MGQGAFDCESQAAAVATRPGDVVGVVALAPPVEAETEALARVRAQEDGGRAVAEAEPASIPIEGATRIG